MQTEQNGQQVSIFCAPVFKNSRCISYPGSPDVHSITGGHSKDSSLHTQLTVEGNSSRDGRGWNNKKRYDYYFELF